MVSPLEKEFLYYVEYQAHLLPDHRGKYLLIRDERLVGAFETERQAIKAGMEQFELGTFLIQKCEAGEESYTQTFHSRVLFDQ